MDQVIVEYKSNLAILIDEHKQLQKEGKTTEAVTVKAANATSTAIQGTTNKVQSLKSQVRELKAQLANTTDPKEVLRLSKSIGELSDKINDANESAKVFSTSSKFEQMNNAFGSMVANVRNLDFARAAEQSKVLLGIVKSLTFAEAISGVKALGQTLLNLGKALLTNPVTLLAAALAALVYVVYDLVSAYKEFNTASKTLTDSLKDSEDRIVKLGDRYAEAKIKMAEAEGRFTKAQADAAREEIKILRERTDLRKKFVDDITALAKEAELDLAELEKGGFDETYTGDNNKRLSKIKFNREFLELQKRFRQEQSLLIKTETEEQIALAKERTKKALDQQKVNNLRIKELNQQHAIEMANQAAELNNVLRDLRTENIAPDYEREKQALKDKLADDIRQYSENGAIIAELRIRAINQLNEIDEKQRLKEQTINEAVVQASKDKTASLQKNEEELDASLSEMIVKRRDKEIDLMNEVLKTDKEIAEERMKLQEKISSAINESLSSLGQISRNISDGKIQEVERQADSELSALEKQYKAQLISKEQYEKKKDEINKKAHQEEAILKRRQFEVDKNIATVQAIINIAQAVTKAYAVGPPLGFVFAALVAASGALQVAAIRSQPTPKFSKGGKIGGQLHSEGGTIIEAERDEWIIRRDQAIKHSPMLRAINEGQADNFIRVHYIAPALKEQKAKYDRMLSINTRSEAKAFNDERLLDSEKFTRAQNRENILFLAKTIKQNNSRSRHKW